MKWLFVTAQFPWPIIHGRWLRVYHLARTLASLGEEVAIQAGQISEGGEAAYAAVGVQVASGIGRPHVSQGRARYLLSPYAYDRDFARLLAARIPGYDVVVLCGRRVLQYVPEASSARQVLLDMVDDPRLEFTRRSAVAPADGTGSFRRWRDRFGRSHLEKRTLRYVDYTSFVSREDCASFNSRHPAQRTLFVPNGVDVDYFANPSIADGAGTSIEPTVVFNGHMSNPNNEAAAKYLVGEVAPLIWRELPHVHIQLVGAEPSAAVLSLRSERVTVTGRVADIRPFLWQAGVVLLSMVSGTGIKNKLLEAWAAGAPVVATPIACQGVPAVDGDNLLLGDTPADLATATCRLLADPATRRVLAVNGRATVLRELTWEAAARRLLQVFAGEDGYGA